MSNQVYAAISQVMAGMAKDGISKSRKNEQQGYKFRGIDDVYNALSGQLTAAKLVILPRVLSREVTERQTKNGGALFYVVLDVEFDLVAEDASKHTVRTVGEAMDSGDKATNKAMSAAYKYMAMEVFCIPTEGDNDADSTTHEVAAKPANVPGRTGANDEGKNLYEALTADDRDYYRTHANATEKLFAAGDNDGMVQYVREEMKPTQDELLILWHLLAGNSKLRSAYKAASAKNPTKAQLATQA